MRIGLIVVALVLSCSSESTTDGGAGAPPDTGSPGDLGGPGAADSSDTTASPPDVVGADAGEPPDALDPDAATQDALDDTTEADVGERLPPFKPPEGEAVGVAVIDITPQDFETFTDLNGNHTFDGCRHEPAGGTPECPEPYDDKNGNLDFDATFIGGFQELRAALGVHDPIEVRALVVARGLDYLVFVSVDVVGLAGDRIQRAQDRLAEKGWDPDRIIVVSSHTHQGPDVRGLWGEPLGDKGVWSGARPEYNASITDAIVEAVDAAGAAVEPATFRIGATRMRDRSPYFNGARFGGLNPTPKLHGLLNDGRDPVIVSDQLVVIEASSPGGAPIARLVSFSGHPELVGDENNLLSADYVHFLRTELEARRGGTTVFVPECLGGMQSTLGGHVPLVAEDGTWQVSTDAEGNDVPVFSNQDGFEYARSAGVHLADAAVAALEAGEALPLDPFVVSSRQVYFPVDNGTFQLLFQLGIFDVDPAIATRDPVLCPGWNGESLHPGCVPATVWHVRLGAAEMLTAPGEVLPELFWGLPDDPDFAAESAQLGLRGTRGDVVSRYFPQHPASCDTTDYADCVFATEFEGCDCTRYHVAPYTLQTDASAPAPVQRLTAKYRFLVGMADDHLGYVVPEPDFNRIVTALSGDDGDHYEETNSLTYRLAPMLLEAWDSLLSAQTP